MQPSMTPQTQQWLARLEAKERHQFVEVADHQVGWRQFGQGEPLVLLHGGHGSWLHWAHNIEALAEHYAVWVPNLPGYGDSSAPRFETMTDMVAVMQANLDQLFGQDTLLNLCGFSFGGLVSAKLAAQRSSVKRLALLGPGGHGGPRRPRGELKNWKRLEDEASLLEAMHHNLWVHMLYAQDRIDTLALDIHTQACIQTRFRSRGLSAQPELKHALDQYEGKTLILWGEHDVTATPEVLQQTLVTAGKSRAFDVIGGVGHWVQYEASEQLNPRLLDWFKTLV